MHPQSINNQMTNQQLKQHWENRLRKIELMLKDYRYANFYNPFSNRLYFTEWRSKMRHKNLMAVRRLKIIADKYKIEL